PYRGLLTVPLSPSTRQMIRSSFLRSASIALSAFVLASCADPTGPASSTPLDPSARHSDGSDSGTGSLGSLTNTSNLELRAVWWDRDFKDVITVRKTIGPAGGTISIPE